MNETKHREAEFDAFDAALASALADEAAWPAPGAGFEERCTARVEAIIKEERARRVRWSFAKMPALMKFAAALAAMLAFASLVFDIGLALEPPSEQGGVDGAPRVRADFGSKCEFTARLLEKEVSRKAAVQFLANVCMAGGI